MATPHVSAGHVHDPDPGRGEPVVLLHSSASSGAQWRALAEGLAARYRVIAPDLHGYGATAPWPGQRPFSLACEAELVLARLGQAEEPAHLVGHSYGGAVALHVAARHRHRVRSLTLIEPVAFHLLREDHGPALAEIEAVAAGVTQALARGDHLGGMRGFIEYWGGPTAWAALPPERREAIAARLPKIALDFHATVHEPTSLAHFRVLAVPTLVVHGTDSPAPTRRICDLLARTLPVARLACIAGAGHMAPITHRDQVNDLVAWHLAANRGRNAPWLPAWAPADAAPFPHPAPV